MDLRAKLQAATKEAMKARDSARLSTLRLIAAAVKDREIAARSGDTDGTLTEGDLVMILSRMVKQRQESAKAYEEGGRLELAAKEEDEIGDGRTEGTPCRADGFRRRGSGRQGAPAGLKPARRITRCAGRR